MPPSTVIRPTGAAHHRNLTRAGAPKRWTRTTVAALHVVDSATLRDAARRRLFDGITICLGPPTTTPDQLDPHEEITTSAAAVR
jgi:hypothetical protein